MSQPSGSKNIVDWNSNTDANGVRVYQAGFSQKFFFPATNDVLISYAPIRNKPGPAQDVKSYMGRIKLRAIFVNANMVDGAPRLSDSDSRDAKTVVDEQYRYYKIVDPCLAKDTSEVCIADTGCAWDESTKCAAKVIQGDTCPNHNLKPLDCKADKTCFYSFGRCAKKTGCAALLTTTTCGGDSKCTWDVTATEPECIVKPPPACNTLTTNTTCTVGRDDCEWFPKQNKCDQKAKECEQWSSSVTCNAQIATGENLATTYNKCTWNRFKCADVPAKASTAAPCGSNIDETTCNAEKGCSWLTKADKDGSADAKMNSYCAPVSCGGYTDQA